MIRIEDVAVELGGREVLRDVSLSVPPREFLALVGPNGAGKTTLLRTVNGLVEPTRGRVEVAGEPVAGRSTRDLARRVATVPQGTSIGFDFSARDVVAMGRTPHQSRFSAPDEADGEAVERALERTETAGLPERPVGELSGGERQRVLLARALAQATPVLLLDEPTASLDINHQVGTLSLVRDLAAEGRTAVAAIHDLDLAARFCDRLALLAGGELAAVGSPREVLTAERLERAYGVRTVVSEHPVTGTPTVTALGPGEGLSEGPPGAGSEPLPSAADDD
ncbi:heme ABC transporter ATP-binding protein [Halobacteriales archaeon QS_5_70_15]|nr:MAG: heme ABC transporter ATP-binding protein [Halobacteriales archaeon QS_5_70_15]